MLLLIALSSVREKNSNDGSTAPPSFGSQPRSALIGSLRWIAGTRAMAAGGMRNQHPVMCTGRVLRRGTRFLSWTSQLTIAA